jgi:hypothetical protein
MATVIDAAHETALQAAFQGDLLGEVWRQLPPLNNTVADPIALTSPLRELHAVP